MDLWKILLVTMCASGFVVVASFRVEDDLNHRDRESGPVPKECGFCYYYFQTGHSPYEVLWKLGLEIRSHTTLKAQILMLMDPRLLKIAEHLFHDYCRKTCGKRGGESRQGNGLVFPCQNKNGVIDYNN